MTKTDYIAIGAAFASLLTGVWAVRKRQTSYQIEWGEGGEARGMTAVLLGVFWILAGCVVLLAYLLEYFGIVELSGIRDYLRFFLIGDESVFE